MTIKNQVYIEEYIKKDVTVEEFHDIKEMIKGHISMSSSRVPMRLNYTQHCLIEPKLKFGIRKEITLHKIKRAALKSYHAFYVYLTISCHVCFSYEIFVASIIVQNPMIYQCQQNL